MVRVVFFDLGNVIVRVNLAAAVARIAVKFHIQEDQVLESSLMKLEKQFEKGLLTIDDYLTAAKQIYKFDGRIGIEDLVEIWQSGFELNPEVWQIVQYLRRQVPVFLLSNTNALHIRAIRSKYAILDEMDGLALSYEAGTLKPEPEIYEYALRQAGVSAGEALFVDDLPENVAGAERLGIRAHQFTDPARLRIFLQAEGLPL